MNELDRQRLHSLITQAIVLRQLNENWFDDLSEQDLEELLELVTDN